MKLFLLGPPQFELNEAAIEVESRKGLALLAYLAVTGQSHSRDGLSTLLWPGSGQSRARSYLRHTLWSLKKTLGESWFEISREQVGIYPEADLWLDVTLFRQHLERTQELEPSRELQPDYLVQLGQAVRLYRGDFLAGFTLPDALDFDEWQFFQREELRQMLAGALERLSGALSAQADYEAAIPHARRWVALDPLHEPAQRTLMQLYANAGQESAALRQYQECVHLLEDELGVEPEQETTTLFEAIKARRLVAPLLRAEQPKVQPDQRAQNKSNPPSSTQIDSPAPVLADQLTDFPPQPTPFIGREKELAEIEHHLLAEPGCRLLTLIGPGGVGKTYLAIEAVKRVSTGSTVPVEFADGLVFIPLAPVSSTTSLVVTIAQAVGMNFYDNLPPRQQLLNYLAKKRMLLVLDNFEHLLAPVHRRDSLALLSDILAATAAIKLLVTSRETLYLREAWVRPLAGLTFPDSEAAPEHPPIEYDAIRLFEQSARRARGDFSLPAEQTHVIRICRLVEGMPLAIELAADWLRALPAKEIADEIERNLDILTARVQNVPDRHRSIRVVVEQSWSLLDEQERAVLECLAVCRGGFRQEAAQVIAGASLLTLASLVEKSWLRLTKTGRYQIHELLRQFAGEKLEERPERNRQIQTRHSQYFTTFLRQRAGHITGKRQSSALAEIQEERKNIQAGWNWAVNQGQVEIIDQTLDCLYNFYRSLSCFEEGEEAFSRVAELWHAPDLPPEIEDIIGRALARQGVFCLALGQYGRAAELFERSLTFARRQDARQEEAFALSFLGETAKFRGEYELAKRLLQESLDISVEIGDRLSMAHSLQKLGWTTEEEQGEYLEARRYYEQALTLYKTLDQRTEVAVCLDKLGHNAWKRGEYEQSAQLHRESLAIFKEVDDRLGIANNLGGLALYAWSYGRMTEAKTLMAESLVVCRQTGNRSEEANRLRMLGMIANSMADYDSAMAFSQEALTIAEEIAYDQGIIIDLNNLAEAACGLGDFQTARNYLQQAMRRALDKSKAPQALEALLIWAELVLAENNSADIAPSLQGTYPEQEQALEILTLVVNHPATWQIFKDRAAHLLAELKVQLPAEVVRTPQEKGSRRPWTEVVSDILSREREWPP